MDQELGEGSVRGLDLWIRSDRFVHGLQPITWCPGFTGDGPESSLLPSPQKNNRKKQYVKDNTTPPPKKRAPSNINKHKYTK